MGAQGPFKVGGKAVYPAHGVGEIVDIQTRVVAGRERSFFVLKIIENGMKIMVPVDTAETTGMRAVINRKKADEVYDILKSTRVSVKTQPWNRRHREYMEMLKSGSPSEVAKVLRDLYRLKGDKDLSFGERRLLDMAKSLLVAELALATNVNEETVEAQIQDIFGGE